MKRLALLSALALATSSLVQPAAAQIAPAPAIAPTSTLLSISAEGRTSRKPDLAVFTAGVASTAKTASEALSKNSADMAKVIAALKRAGIADRDIQTSDIGINPVYADRSRTSTDPLEQQIPLIVGYQANNTVTVKQRNLAEFGKVIDTLVTAGANQVNGPSFQVEQADSALDEARIAAVKKARDRATLYARATGLKVGRIVAISESGGYSQPVAMYRRDVAQAAAVPIAPGEVSLEINVSVQFELTP